MLLKKLKRQKKNCKNRHHKTNLPKKRKVLSHYKEGQAPVEFVTTAEEHYYQGFISAEICLHWNSSDNGNTALIAWKRFWSWILLYRISSLHSSDLDKFN